MEARSGLSSAVFEDGASLDSAELPCVAQERKDFPPLPQVSVERGFLEVLLRAEGGHQHLLAEKPVWGGLVFAATAEGVTTKETVSTAQRCRVPPFWQDYGSEWGSPHCFGKNAERPSSWGMFEARWEQGGKMLSVPKEENKMNAPLAKNFWPNLCRWLAHPLCVSCAVLSGTRTSLPKPS